jgi:hypothetical protein
MVKFFASTVISILFMSFILTSINVGHGFSKQRFVEEIDYPKYRLKLYIYESDLDFPKTYIKLKDNPLPIIKNVIEIENHRAIEIRKWKNGDTLYLKGKNVEVIFNLRLRTIKKIPLQSTDT